MKLFFLLFALALRAVPAAAAEEPKTTLRLKAKEAIANLFPHRHAPFVHPMAESDLELVPPPRDPRRNESRSSCENATSLCYDSDSGRIVYRPARELMPTFPGLRPENISVKRDRIVFRYSF